MKPIKTSDALILLYIISASIKTSQLIFTLVSCQHLRTVVFTVNAHPGVQWYPVHTNPSCYTTVTWPFLICLTSQSVCPRCSAAVAGKHAAAVSADAGHCVYEGSGGFLHFLSCVGIFTLHTNGFSGQQWASQVETFYKSFCSLKCVCKRWTVTLAGCLWTTGKTL